MGETAWSSAFLLFSPFAFENRVGTLEIISSQVAALSLSLSRLKRRKYRKYIWLEYPFPDIFPLL